VPPHELVEHGVALIIKFPDTLLGYVTNLLVPFRFDGGERIHTPAFDLLRVFDAQVCAEFGDGALFHLTGALEQQSLIPPALTFAQEALLLPVELLRGEPLLAGVLPQPLQPIR